MLGELGQELRHAARRLGRAPGFAGVATLTLALGIGAATAIFTLLDAVVLRPLPYRDDDRLVLLSPPVPLLQGQTRWRLARHQMYYFLEHGRTLENLGLYQANQVTVGAGDAGASERVLWVTASASLLHVLGFVP